jgi:hypothetical protein
MVTARRYCSRGALRDPEEYRERIRGDMQRSQAILSEGSAIGEGVHLALRRAQRDAEALAAEAGYSSRWRSVRDRCWGPISSPDVFRGGW